MNEHDLLLSCGGSPTYVVGAGPLDAASDPGAVAAWNFGLVDDAAARQAYSAVPGLHDRFPRLAGKWDGSTTINFHDAVRKVLGKDIPAHYQSLGTCGGRAGSRGAEILQCVMIAGGKRAKFHYVSHAWLYYTARRKYGMLGSGDGVAGGAIPEVMESEGLLHRDEAGDPHMNGPENDKVAGAWGAGRLSSSEAKRLGDLAKNNLITARVRVRSAQELADGIASGGVGVGSDAQGYTMQRDAEGCCSPRGTWYHYHVRSGVRKLASGRKVFQYDQSWGDTTPSGPLLPGCPGNVFGVDWDVQDRLCRSGEWDVIFAFDLWDLEQGNVDLDWLI